MTPCEKLGYKVGDRFECVEGNVSVGRYAGDILILKHDDGSEYPWFENVTRNEEYTACCLRHVKPLNARLKSGDEITQDGKKYRVTLEEIPQYDFKPGMLCRVIWDGSEYCSMHSGCTRVVYIENSSTGREMVSYACEGGDLAIGFVNTSSLRPE